MANRKQLDFSLRSEEERRWFTENTWCDNCNEADLGIVDPIEFEESGVIFVEGKCKKCGKTVISKIQEKVAN
jgi:hypothetical protein